MDHKKLTKNSRISSLKKLFHNFSRNSNLWQLLMRKLPDKCAKIKPALGADTDLIGDPDVLAGGRGGHGGRAPLVGLGRVSVAAGNAAQLVVVARPDVLVDGRHVVAQGQGLHALANPGHLKI